MVVPFAAGGPTDIVARIMAEYFSRILGQQFVIENVAGAGGTTGPPVPRSRRRRLHHHDGSYGDPRRGAGLCSKGLKYDPAKSFEPDRDGGRNADRDRRAEGFRGRRPEGFIAEVKSGGPSINQAHAGVGSVSHSTGILFDAKLGAKPTLVVYRGTGPALNDLMAGQVDFMTDQIVNVAPQITGGTIKAYAIATPERSPALPDVPTTKEAGLDDYEVSAWNAVFAPKGLPKDVGAKLEAALGKALEDENTRKRILDLGGTVPASAERGPAALQKLVESEVTRWTPVLRAAADSTP